MRKKSLNTVITANNSEVKFQDETKVHPALKEYFGYCLNKAAAWHRILMNESLAKYNIQGPHLGIMKIIESTGATSQIQLGEELGIDKASMVKMIDRLEKLKFVTRFTHPTDRRIKNIKLTASGLKMLLKLSEIKTKAESEFFKHLTAEEEKFLRKIITKVLPK